MNIPAGASQLFLESSSLFCCEGTIGFCPRFGSSNPGLLPLELADFLRGKLSRSHTLANPCLLRVFAPVNRSGDKTGGGRKRYAQNNSRYQRRNFSFHM